MSTIYCRGCGLVAAFCCCHSVKQLQSEAELVILQHENEEQRPTTTSKLITRLLTNATRITWSRVAPPDNLLKKINSEQYNCWLLFPADRPELIDREKQFERKPGKTDLIIIPDGTWKEVRKIIRKSSWLRELPLLSFTPSKATRYDLRRNPDKDHLCTAETTISLLELLGEEQAAKQLSTLFNQFMISYKRSKGFNLTAE